MPRIAASEDIAWIEDTIASFKPIVPVTPSVEHVRVREEWVRQRVAQIPPSRLPGLIVALFNVYEVRKSDSFSELMWTIEALYGALPERIMQKARPSPRPHKSLN
jgi:hypothetical protein